MDADVGGMDPAHRQVIKTITLFYTACEELSTKYRDWDVKYLLLFAMT